MLDLNLKKVLTKGLKMPKGCDYWGIKTVRPDLSTRFDYVWASEGWNTVCESMINPANDGPCPSGVDDGICVAQDFMGMASGGLPARTIMLVAFAHSDILGRDAHKIRVRKAFTVKLFDGQHIIPMVTNLKQASLSGMEFCGNFENADMSDVGVSGSSFLHLHMENCTMSGMTGSLPCFWHTDFDNCLMLDLSVDSANFFGATFSDCFLSGNFGDLTSFQVPSFPLEHGDTGEWWWYPNSLEYRPN